MKYTKVDTEDGFSITSVISGGNDKPVRLKEGKMVRAGDHEAEPLMRAWTRNTSENAGKGNYRLAVRETGGAWQVLDYKFSQVKSAAKHFESLLLFFEDVAVLQVWGEDETKKIVWTGLTRDDPTDYGEEDTGEENV